tara:strand:+ start:328 stop:615 length:288 start_codon:yes stop_codon:yes gene_type:complete
VFLGVLLTQRQNRDGEFGIIFVRLLEMLYDIFLRKAEPTTHDCTRLHGGVYKKKAVCNEGRIFYWIMHMELFIRVFLGVRMVDLCKNTFLQNGQL